MDQKREGDNGYILVVNDKFSKINWTVPLKSKNAQKPTFLKRFSIHPKKDQI